MSWSELESWWLAEVAGDPAYVEVIDPLLFEVFHPEPGKRYLDAGCGDGRVMKLVDADVYGIDINEELARRARRAAVAALPNIPMGADSFDGVYSVLTFEHIADHVRFFEETARVTRSGGILAMVVNHPTWTAPDSTPITDSDGEVLWRPGDYFGFGETRVGAGESSVTFHHRSMSALLNAAADAGWGLQRMVERPHHEYVDQAGIPRLLGCLWRLVTTSL